MSTATAEPMRLEALGVYKFIRTRQRGRVATVRRSRCCARTTVSST
ncbi:MAG: hypothetical protein H0W76_04480 [Pyrinomonadaceae bacterium]|nr:hypothetical protein [Pyrinomonadaceae bacterium]